LTGFSRLFTASVASNVGDGLRLAALPLLAASLTRDPGAIAAITAVIMLPWLLFGAIGGAIVDRVDRVRLLSSVQIGRMAVVAVLAIIVWTGNASMPLVYLAAFLFGIGEVLADTTMQTLVPALVPDERLEHANGRLYASQSVGNEFVGPPVGSVLFAAVPAAPFALNAVAWGAAAAVLAGLHVEQPHRAQRSPESLLQDVVAGARWLLAQPMLRALVVWAVFVNAALTCFASLYVLFALEVLGISEAAFGFLTAVAGMGGVAGTLVAGRVVARFGRGLVVQGGSVLCGASAIGAGMLASVVPFAALLFVLTASAAVVIVVLTALRQSIVPNRLLGRATATMRMMTYGAVPLGALFGGWLASAFDLRAPFLVGGAVTILAGLAIGRWLTPEAIERARADAVRGLDQSPAIASRP
jgi:MFS family permease